MKEKTNRKIWQKLLVIGIIMVMFIGSMPITVSQAKAEAETKNTDAKSVDGTIILFSDDMEGTNYWESTGCWERGEISTPLGKNSAKESSPLIGEPTVTGHVPLNGATGVLVGRNIEVTFSKSMDTASVESAFSSTPNLKPGVFTWILADTSFSFNPNSDMAYSTTYTITIGTGAQDKTGNNMASPYSWSFTTEAEADTTPPTVTAHVPLVDAPNVLVGANIEVTFSEPMDIASVEGAFSSTPGLGLGTFTWGLLEKTFTLNPGSDMTYSTTYTITIGTGAQDKAGNNMVSPYSWSFTTEAEPDTTPPTVTGHLPLDGATNVLVITNIEVTFSEPMNTASVESAFSSSPPLGSGTFTWGLLSRTFTFNPASDMSYSTTYTVTIGTGAQDQAGNNMVSPYSWSFTTKAEPYNPGNCSGTNLAGDYPNNANDTLTSPTIDLVGATSATITFYHLYRMELNTAETQAYDGGVVEITTDDTTWYQIQPVGGYPSTVDSSANNPAFDTGTGVYSGIVDWGLQTFDLSSYVDNRIRIRFRFGSNSAGTRLGWHIDNVTVTAMFPLDDTGVMQIGVYNPARRENPYRNIVPLGCPIKIYGMIRNYGVNNQNLFNVSCTITDPDSVDTVLTKQITLGSRNITDAVWQYIPRKNGNYSIKVSTGLLGDEIISNDMKTVNIQTDTFIFLDDGEYSPEISGLIYTNQSNINSSAWQITNTTSHNGTQSWWCGNNTTGYYMNSMNEPLITPQIYLSNLSDCKLSFYTKYHLEGSRRYIIRRPYPFERFPYDRYILCSDYEEKYLVNISATPVYTDEAITFNVTTLNGSTISNVTWLFGDDVSAYGSYVTHSYADDGNYTVDIIITDTIGEITKLQATITVLNRPPVPVIDAYQIVNVTLRVAGKKDNTVTLTLMENDTVVGETSVTREAGNPDEQSKTIELKVRGNKTYDVSLEYNATNGANPVKIIIESKGKYNETEITLNAEHDKEIILNLTNILDVVLENNTEVIFNASQSYDPDGYIIDYSWDFGDGTNASGEILIHTYMEDGAYNVTLNITDDDGASANQTTSIHLSRLIIDGKEGWLWQPWPRPWPPWWWRPIWLITDYDNIYVEVSTDSENWSRLGIYPRLGYKNSSSNPDNVDGWVHMEYNLSGYIGQNVSVRFRMKSDSSTIYEGAYIDDILINGTYVGEIPEPPSFNFYGEAFRGSTNITDIYLHLHPLLLEPIANIVDEVKIKLLNQNNNTIETKTYTNVNVEYGDTLHFHEFMNCTYINASLKINNEIHERSVNIEEMPDITPAKSTATSETSSIGLTEEPKTTSSKVGVTETIFFDDMESGENGWEKEGYYWKKEKETNYVGWIIPWGEKEVTKKHSLSLWHITSYRSNSPSHSWVYNLEKPVGASTYNTGMRNCGRLYHDVDLTMYGDPATYGSVTLGFYFFLDRENSRQSQYDKAIVQVSTNNGKTWKNQMEYIGSCRYWSYSSVDLSPYSGKSIKIGFYFDTVDGKYNNYEGWYIDDVKVTASMAVDVWKNYSPPYNNSGAEPQYGDFTLNYGKILDESTGEGCASAGSVAASGLGKGSGLITEFIKIACGEGDGKVWFASHKEADAEEYLYAPAKGYVYMNTTLGVVHTDKTHMWFLSSVYVEAVLEVHEYNQLGKRIETHKKVIWSKNYEGYWTDVPISGHIEIDWQQNHRYISKIVFHAHSESDTLPFFPSVSRGHAFIGGWAQNMVWYVP
ncbi:MAG: Ig-like domain-containing protein [Thermoplasmatales archaeon]|nr:Ig-like domain-containing protein [Thermoplasmatales archaeon]